MRRAFHIVIAITVMGALASTHASGTSVLYSCTMSGEVSKTCCCSGPSEDGCISLERQCKCCDVSMEQNTDAPVQAVPHGDTTRCAPNFSVILPVDAASVGCANRTFAWPRQIPARCFPIYILNSTLLR
jgi:hypothetical protein